MKVRAAYGSVLAVRVGFGSAKSDPTRPDPTREIWSTPLIRPDSTHDILTYLSDSTRVILRSRPVKALIKRDF